MNPFALLMTMYHIAWSPLEEEDEDYKPVIEVRRIVTDIPKFPDISAFGPTAVGALKKLKDWIDNDVGEWLSAHEKEEFLDEDHGIPVQEEFFGGAGVGDDHIKQEDPFADVKGDVDVDKDTKAQDAQQGEGIPKPKTYQWESLSKEEKKRKKLCERKMQNYKQSQSTFYAEIKKAVKDNSDVLREISAVPKCVDRGSRAIEAIRKYITQSPDLVSVEQDSEKYFTDAATSFTLKYPYGSIQPINCKPKDVNDTLGRALFELEQHVNDFKDEFRAKPDKYWTKYYPEQNMIQIIRDLLPETSEWRLVKMGIKQGVPSGCGNDFVLAIGTVRTYISEFRTKAEKLAIHRTGNLQSDSPISASPGVPSGKPAMTKEEKKAKNDEHGLDANAKCYTCGAKGHKSNWWGCPQYEANQKKKKNGGGKGKGKGKGGRRGGGGKDKGKDKGKGDRSKRNEQEEEEVKDYSEYKCNKCLNWGHIAKDCPGRSADEVQYANPIVPSPFCGNHIGAGSGYMHQPMMMPMMMNAQPQQLQLQQHPSASYNTQPPSTSRELVVRNAGVHVQSSPMQALQQNLREASQHAPPAGSWNRNMQGPNFGQ